MTTTPARVHTGIQGLDSQIGGGFPAGTSLLLIADSTNALYQFLEELALSGVQQGETVVWFELDRPWGIANGMLHTAGDKAKNLTMLHAYEPRVGQVSANGSGAIVKQTTPREIPQLLVQMLSQVEPNKYRMVLCSLSTLLQTVPPKEVLGLVRQLVALGQELGGLQVFTIVRGVHPEDQIAQLKHACTAVFQLGVERKGFGIYSYLQIEKLLGVSDAARIMLFNETENGLRLESTRRVF